MRSEGVWQDPRVPFVPDRDHDPHHATWTKAQLLDTLAARGEFGSGFIGAEAAAAGYFGRAVDQLTLAAGGDGRGIHRRRSCRSVVRSRGRGQHAAGASSSGCSMTA